MGIDPVHVGEGTSADMVVDADEESIFEAFKSRAMDAVAFENDGGFVVACHSTGLNHLIGKWKGLVDARYAVMQNYISLLPHLAQNLTAGEGRTDRVAVGTSVGRQHETLALSDLPEDVLKHTVRPSPREILCDFCCASLRALTIVRPELYLARRGQDGNTIPGLGVYAIAPPVRAGYNPSPLRVHRDFDRPRYHPLQ